MKRITMMGLTAALLVAFASLALADGTPSKASTATPRVERREARQHARIRQGVKSGELTRGEAANLRHGQRHVARMERRAKADGVVTPAERARLNHAQNVQSKKIYRKKHNARTR